MYYNLNTGESLTNEQAREIERQNAKLENSGNLADMFKIQILIKLG